VPLGAVLAAKRPQQKKRQNEQFKKPAPVRTANVKGFAGGTATQQKKSVMGHGHMADLAS
jgi:hypothetical protein